jgi:hypothetical protein
MYSQASCGIRRILLFSFLIPSLSLYAQNDPAVASLGSEMPDAPLPVLAPAVTPFSFSTAVHEPTLMAQSDSSGTPQNPSTIPSLDDLGLTKEETKSDPDMQARLNLRSHMLKVHQRLGLITLVPLAAACISSAAAPPDPKNGSGNTVGRDIHLSLGSLSVLSYGATAYYAIRAPKVDDGKARGGIKLHKYLIYIHGPGMILTPILGAMAFNQANNGERVHGIASAHSAVAWTTVASYSAAILAVSWPIHLRKP